MAHKKVDPKWYLNKYPDVKHNQLSAQEHYEQFGKKEGRFPCKPTIYDYLITVPIRLVYRINPILNKAQENFALLFTTRKVDAEWYLKNNPDVAASGIPPQEHYNQFGKTEGRLPTPPNKLDKFIARCRLFIKVLVLIANQNRSYLIAIKIMFKEYKKNGFVGLKHFVVLTFKQYEHTQKGISYKQWLAANDNINLEKLSALANTIEQLPEAPLISVVMATYNTPVAFLESAVNSVLKQPYKKWELCIADDHSSNANTLACLKKYQSTDKRIKVLYREKNGHISEATNSALTLVKGDYVAFMDHDDELHPAALVSVAKAIQENPSVEFIYSDEDKIDESGNRSDPYFKSDFNYEFLLTQNYICHLAIVKTSLVKKLGGLNSNYNGAQDHEFTLRVIEQIKPEQILHIPSVLYHWRIHSGSTAASTATKPYAIDAGRKAVKDHLDRMGVAAYVIPHPEVPFWHRVKFSITPPFPSVEIIIPTRDRIDLMRMCVNSILSRTTYGKYHITIVDNGSVEKETAIQFSEWSKDPRIKVIRDDSPFNYSQLNNKAVKTTNADYVCLLNNDIEIVTPDWLEELVSVAARPDIGCVGARLWYPNNTLQHGGVIIGIGGVAGHSHKYLEKGRPGYFGRAISLQALSAVTAACLLIKRSIYNEVNGLDEEMKVAFNDVDFCLRVREAGYRNVWTPFAEMYHHESATRGHEDNPEKVARFQREVELMKKRWGDKLEKDPFYSPNLTLIHEDFSLAEATRPGNLV